MKRVWISLVFWSGVVLFLMAALDALILIVEGFGLFLSADQIFRSPAEYRIEVALNLLQVGALIIGGIAAIRHARVEKAALIEERAKHPFRLHKPISREPAE